MLEAGRKFLPKLPIYPFRSWSASSDFASNAPTPTGSLLAEVLVQLTDTHTQLKEQAGGLFRPCISESGEEVGDARFLLLRIVSGGPSHDVAPPRREEIGPRTTWCPAGE